MTPAYRVIILPEAFDDIDKIVEHIAKDSRQNAAAMIDRLYAACLSLGTFPRRYKVYRSSKNPSYVVHSMPVPPFIIYYRVMEHPQTVRILTVRHCARRQPKRFS